MEFIYKCSKCQVELTKNNCYISKDKKYANRNGFLHTCKKCRKAQADSWRQTDKGREMHRLSEAKRRAKNKEKYLWQTAKYRAENKGLEFAIEVSDIVIPEFCPVLGIKLKGSDGIDLDISASPSIDRIDSSKGYTKENIVVMSRRANCLKNDATREEIEKIFHWYSNL